MRQTPKSNTGAHIDIPGDVKDLKQLIPLINDRLGVAAGETVSQCPGVTHVTQNVVGGAGGVAPGNITPGSVKVFAYRIEGGRRKVDLSITGTPPDPLGAAPGSMSTPPRSRTDQTRSTPAKAWVSGRSARTRSQRV